MNYIFSRRRRFKKARKQLTKKLENYCNFIVLKDLMVTFVNQPNPI